MTISPINFRPISQNGSNKVRAEVNNAFIKQGKAELPKIPPELLKAQIIRKPQYLYKPVSSVKPNFEPIGHYDDIDEFSKLYADKINSQLMIPTEKDIENLIGRIKQRTNADEKQIREVLYTLAKFTNYDSLAYFPKFIKDENINSFGLPYQFMEHDTCDFSSNSAINYLIKNKHFLELSNDTNKPQKICYILDDSSLSQLEHYKNSTNEREREIFNKFTDDVKNDKYAFVIIKGWDIKTASHGYKSANFLTGSGYIEDLAVETVKRIQNGENPDKIYYSDFEERFDNLFDDKETKKHAIITGLYQQENLKEITNKNLLNILSPKPVSKDYISTVIKSYLDVKTTKYGYERTQTALLKYLDEMTVAYSTDSLALALKKMGRNIESMLNMQGFSKDNTAYIVPLCNKSYSLISCMYSKINGIDPKNINSTFNITDENLKKAKVILDDLSASGTSEGKNCIDIRINYKNGKLPIIYAPVVLCNHVEDYVSRPSTSCPNGYCFDKYIFDMSNTSKMANALLFNDMKLNLDLFEQELREHIKHSHKLLDFTDSMILSEILFHGYDANALCVVFPYMIPDNASDIAGLILRNTLAVTNNSTNKALNILYNHRNNYKVNYDDIIKIIKLINERYFGKK